MKKLIALLLVLVTLLGVASAAFTDQKEITETYAEAVSAMVEAGVVGGFPDGTFQPKGTLTRAQAAKIITVLLEGDKAETVTAASAGFADVPAGNWAEKYVNYCAEKKIVAGVGNNKFNPNGELTGAAWAKMLLVAYGHDAAELTGEKWFSNTQKAIREKGMNKNAFTSDSPTNREKACQLAYNFYHNTKVQEFETNVLAPAGYKETTISLAGGKNVKLLGRAEATDNGVVTNFPADGMEFTLDCGGTLKVTIDAKRTTDAYQLFIDGKAVSSTWAKTAELELATLIEPGMHTIRIVQDKEVDTSGKVNTVSAITVSTKGGEMKATAPGKYFIEYIGASCEAGCGTLGGNKDPWGIDYHSATHSHCYLTAVDLEADYAIVAKGGIGLLRETSKRNQMNLYKYHNGYRSETPYTPARKPDVIVTNIPGGNDNAYFSEDELFEQGKIFYDELRKLNGASTKIVFIGGNMRSSSSSSANASNAKHRLVEYLGGEAKGVYYLDLPNGPNGVPAKVGGTPHPSAEDCVKQAAVMTEFLKGILK